jgi:hypothetical protein
MEGEQGVRVGEWVVCVLHVCAGEGTYYYRTVTPNTAGAPLHNTPNTRLQNRASSRVHTAAVILPHNTTTHYTKPTERAPVALSIHTRYTPSLPLSVDV